MAKIRIFAIDRETNERDEISDMYWFEENYVHDINDPGFVQGYKKFALEIFLDDVLIWASDK